MIDQPCPDARPDSGSDLPNPAAAPAPAEGSATQPSAAAAGISEPLPHGEILRAIDDLGRSLRQGVAGLLATFSDKIAYDAAKEAQFDRLHADLQSYRTDEAFQGQLQWINGLIRLHDNLGKLQDGLHGEGRTTFTREDVCAFLRGFQEEIEILLENGEVIAYREDSPRFTARLQQVVTLVDTEAPELDGAVAARLRPGFVRGERVLRKEKVKVYRLVPGTRTADEVGDPGMPDRDPEPPPTAADHSSSLGAPP